PPHGDQVAVCIHHHDFEILNGDALVAHVTTHAHPFNHTTRRGTCANRTGRARTVRRTMSNRLAAKTMPLDCTGETAPLALTDHIDPITDGKHVGFNLLALFDIDIA